MKNFKIALYLFTFLTISFSCENSGKISAKTNVVRNDQTETDSLLTLIQCQTFEYFWNGADPNSGMAPERINMNGIYPENDKNVVTTGGSGFGVMAILVGIKRGFITKEQGLQRLEKIVSFLEKADRFHGAWPHWMYGTTGRVKPFSPKDDG